jgi:hypothetical protein
MTPKSAKVATLQSAFRVEQFVKMILSSILENVQK